MGRIVVRAWVAVAVVAALASRGEARTLVLVRSEPGDWVGSGQQRVLTGEQEPFEAARNLDDGVDVYVGARPDSWWLRFAAPHGRSIVPGTYEDAGLFPFQPPGKPGLSAFGDGRGCNTLSGRFVVREATYGPGGEVLSFAADFEQHCDDATPALFGSVRYRSGDPACAGQPDGTRCDDADPCTLTESCAHGVCSGVATEACAAAGATCLQARLCDPAGGACLAPSPAPDGAACDDGNPCTLDDACRGGACTGTPRTCNGMPPEETPGNIRRVATHLATAQE
jgi:hypothetical protein